MDGTKASSPAFKMGTSSRFSSKNPMTDVPGVGSYASAVPAYGKQVLSSKSTLPTPKMGTSTRDQALKVRGPARCHQRWFQIVALGEPTALKDGLEDC